jgi:hypothetical protein
MPRKLLIAGALVGVAVPLLMMALWRTRAADPPIDIPSLQRRIDSGEVKLKKEGELGYLRSVLKELRVPVSSQTLVFGKNSAQLFLISPDTPRALYFNDEVYVGYVQGAPHLEIASVDPELGPVFYTLDQFETPKPKFDKVPTDCLACHDTFEDEKPVPRLLVLSTLPDSKGVALKREATVTNDRSPFIERWGGWYVTGTHGNLRHMGNRFVREPVDSLPNIKTYAKAANLNEGANVTDLSKRFDVKQYLTPSSDIVALMVLGHQTHIHNLITAASYALKGKPSEEDVKDRGERMVEAMLFSGAAPLEPVKGTTDFAEEFSAQGPRDSKGRSLHQLDLKTRLLKYPMSYLVYSKSFDAMPAVVHDYAYKRFWEVLSGKDQSKEFAHLTEADRKAILEILQETKPDFAAFVKS